MQELLILQVFLTLVVHIMGALRTGCLSPDWTHYGTDCYMIPDGRWGYWADGREFCQSLGGDLVLPRSQEENDFVYQLALTNYKGTINDNVWFRCHLKDGQWDCAKDPEDYTNWSATLESTGNFGIILMQTNGEWRGVTDGPDYLRRIMCQRAQEWVSNGALTCSAIPHGQPRCLADHTLTEFRVRIHVQCCIACSQDPTCRSFNLKGDMCQLNNVTASEVDGTYFNIVQDCAYFEYKLNV